VVSLIDEMCVKMITELALQVSNGAPVAIADFDDQTPRAKEKNIGFAVSEIIQQDFTESGKFTIIEKKQIAKIVMSLESELTGLYDSDKVVSIGKLVGARYIVVGSISALAGSYNISVRVVEVETGVVKQSRTLEVDSALMDRESAKYGPPAFRLGGGYSFRLLLNPNEDGYIINWHMIFLEATYDLFPMHSLSLRLGYGFSGSETEETSYLNENHSIFSTNILTINDTWYPIEISLGYGRIFKLSRFVLFKPGIRLGVHADYSRFSASYGIMNGSYDGRPVIKENNLWRIEPFIVPSLCMLFSYNNSISLFLDTDIQYFPFKKPDKWYEYAGIKYRSYPIPLSCVNFSGGIRIYF
jgi:TolB-like protein